MRNITSPTQLKAALKNIAKDAINEVAPEVLERLQSNIIDYTYSFDPAPRTWYYDKTGVPTYEFLNAFMWRRGWTTDTPNEVSKELYYNYESMEYEPEKYKHGSEEFGDVRKYLADILNVSGFDAFSNWAGKGRVETGRLRAPYWDNTIRDLFSSAEGGTAELDTLFTKAFRKRGGI